MLWMNAQAKRSKSAGAANASVRQRACGGGWSLFRSNSTTTKASVEAAYVVVLSSDTDEASESEPVAVEPASSDSVELVSTKANCVAAVANHQSLDSAEVAIIVKSVNSNDVEAATKSMSPNNIEAATKSMSPNNIEAATKSMSPNNIEAATKSMSPNYTETPEKKAGHTNALSEPHYAPAPPSNVHSSSPRAANPPPARIIPNPNGIRIAHTHNASSERTPGDRLLYLNIFERILTTVLDGESHLFSDSEIRVLSRFNALDRHARYLFVRLFIRKHAWIRVSDMDYGEQCAESCSKLSDRAPDTLPLLLASSDLHACEDAVALLSVAELKELAKRKRVQVSRMNKEAMCAHLLKSARRPTITSFFGPSRGAAGQQLALRDEVLKVTGPVVMVNPEAAELFERLHLVFFRAPVLSLDDQEMKVAILASIGKIRFPAYKVERSCDLFESRQCVIEYKQLLAVSSDLRELAAAPVKDTESQQKGWELSSGFMAQWEREIAHVGDPQRAETAGTEYWKRHFTPGWALTRIVERSAAFAAALRRYTDEERVLKALLGQCVYRVGKRGALYERLVLVQMTHLRPKNIKGGVAASAAARKTLANARATCISALADKYVGRISRHTITRQLATVERMLGVEPAAACRHPGMISEWTPAPERVFYGVKIRNPRRGGASMWDGDNGFPSSVEQIALWRYEQLGFTGLHSENTIATTVFGVLFWDIIFYPVPGVLDTEYQSMPLDMYSEAFYFTRKEQVDQRLREISAGKWPDLIERVYGSEAGSSCIGVSWEYEKSQLLTICRCLGNSAVSVICSTLAKEYGAKRRGFPDLCLWNAADGKAMFAEVKGPSDKLSEAQRDWIDILMNCGVAVELCLVREQESAVSQKKRKKANASSA